MKREFIIVFICSISLASLFTACKKSDTGTANVIYSSWLDVTYLADTIHIGTLVDTIGFYTNITAPKLTTNTGLCLFQLRISGVLVEGPWSLW